MKIAVFGANGRVGSRVCLLASTKHEVIKIDKDSPLVSADVCIDFSTAEATQRLCNYCKTYNVPLVTGTTGRNEEEQKMIDELKKSVSVVSCANFSEGVSALLYVVETLGKMLKNWDVEIVETHHKGKKDAPSGTAKQLATVLAESRQFEKVTVHSQRIGSVFGTHTVTFAQSGETLTLTHNAENVDVFALGAIKRAEQLLKTTKKSAKR